MHRPPHRHRPSHGFTLMAFLALLVAGTLALIVSAFGPEAMEAYRARKTEAAMAQAREALLGYATTYRDNIDPDAVYGYLPLPDLGTSRNANADPNCHVGGNPANAPLEGCDAAHFAGISFDPNGVGPTVIGRFPWRTLGTEPVRDGYGECLWMIISSPYGRIAQSFPPPVLPPMNWDTLGQVDIVAANGAANLASILASAHDRPVAIIFSPGIALPNQNRGVIGGDDVTECGGNYDVANYLDPDTAGALGGVTNYFGGSTNNASGDTSGPGTPKPIASQGTIFRDADAKLWPKACPTGSNCTLAANDRGLALTSDTLFGAIRKNGNFRIDINSMVDRIVGCLRDQGIPAGFGKISGDDDDDCYGKDVVPLGYYPHYKEMIFTASGSPNVNGNAGGCAGAVIFANQRRPSQPRTTAVERADPANYLEEINLTSSTGPFSGHEQLERESEMQTAGQDIVRCIPATPSFASVESPGLNSAGLPQLVSYTPSTGTITLGQPTTTSINSSFANYLYGCAWTPETHSMGTGLRSHFTFRISDAGFTSSTYEGFTFSIVDGDNNKSNACGAAAQHLGYSGNNTESPFIASPKIAFEVDLRREGVFDPSAPNHLLNGRNDPPTDGANYRGGHVAFAYWGGEMAISTTNPPAPTCPPPAFNVSGTCYLPSEEDDNVHGQAGTARTGFSTPPSNPSAPIPPLAVPPDAPAGFYKLDPDRSSIPVNQDFHVRVELTRSVTAEFLLPQVRIATTASIDLANPYTLINGNYQFAIDGVNLFDGDRVLVKNQFDSSQNGIYIWQGSLPPTMLRATDADSTGDLAGLTVEVRQGTNNAGTIWRQNNANATIGTDSLRWTNIRVKVAVPSTTNLSSPGALLDGIRMSSGDRVFVESAGVYVWNGPAVPMSAASDIAAGSAIQVQQGTYAPAWGQFDGVSWRRLLVRTTTEAPLDLGTPGNSIGGISPTIGDRILVKNQANAAENGIYVWNGVAVPMVRANDADTAEELAGGLTQVLNGTDAGRSFRQTSLTATGTLGTQAVRWEAIDRSSNYLIEAWILPQSNVYNNMIAAMKDTTRPMSVLYPTFTPHLRDTPTIPFPFRNVRLGFTTGQRTTVSDQTITIRDNFTSWLP